MKVNVILLVVKQIIVLFVLNQSFEKCILHGLDILLIFCSNQLLDLKNLNILFLLGINIILYVILLCINTTPQELLRIGIRKVPSYSSICHQSVTRFLQIPPESLTSNINIELGTCNTRNKFFPCSVPHNFSLEVFTQPDNNLQGLLSSRDLQLQLLFYSPTHLYVPLISLSMVVHFKKILSKILQYRVTLIMHFEGYGRR